MKRTAAATLAAVLSLPPAAAQLPRGDRELFHQLVQANLAELESGKLALQKSRSASVRSFAQRMVDEHTVALGELQAIAQRKGVALPTDTDLQQKALARTLAALRDETFDAQYLKRVGVGEHQRSAQLLKRIEGEARDAEMRALAARMLPTVQHHLQTAQAQAGATRTAGRR